MEKRLKMTDELKKYSNKDLVDLSLMSKVDKEAFGCMMLDIIHDMHQRQLNISNQHKEMSI